MTLTLADDGSRSLKIRACNYENRCGGWSNEKYLSGSTFPTTTTIAIPRYQLDEYDGDNKRWDPCAGPVRIKLNPMGHLTSPQIADWLALLTTFATELSSMTGLNVVYAGQTGISFRLVQPESGALTANWRTPTDILVGFAPNGTEHMTGFDMTKWQFFIERCN